MSSKEHLTILSDNERAAFYDTPDFDSEQRLEYLSLSKQELDIALSRVDIAAQVYCILQIGYFKAVQLFFRLEWNDISTEDITFTLEQYFAGQIFTPNRISKHEYYTQCSLIVGLYGYTLWSTKKHESILYNHSTQIICCDVKPQFLALKLLDCLRELKITRPGFTTLQALVSNVINLEWKRLSEIINKLLTKSEKIMIDNLVDIDNSFSKLAALKQDAKDFKYQMMKTEMDKLITLKPLYQMILKIMPQLKLSQQNILYFASLVNYYTSHDLRTKIKTEQAYLYILCYAWQRYQQINDNLITAFIYHVKKYKDKLKFEAKAEFGKHSASRHKILDNMKELIKLYVDDNLADDIYFGEVRKKVFSIVSKEEILNNIVHPDNKKEIDFYWQSFGKLSRSIAMNLRPLASILDFNSHDNNKWLEALALIKSIYTENKRKNIDDYPEETVPKSISKYLLENKKLNLSRYEFWVYRQLESQFNNGHVFLNNSLQHKSLEQELVPMDKLDDYINQLNLPILNTPIDKQLQELFKTLDELWHKFNKLLKANKLKHLRYDPITKTIHLKRPKEDKSQEVQSRFYSQVPIRDIADVLRFANECNYMSAFTHIQPRYSKQKINIEYLIAAIIAQGMNSGNLKLAAISDIPYALLYDTYNSRVRVSTLMEASDILSNEIAKMPIFELHSLDTELLYGGVDGQKFSVERPTIKARHSKKHFGKGKGVVAYTLLARNIPLQVYLISAHEHESYFAFDIWHNNTTEIIPDVITGDMHCINRMNFFFMHCFNGKLYPRFTSLEDQRAHLLTGYDLSNYEDFLVKPSGQITDKNIENNWRKIQQIGVVAANPRNFR